jgi:hypothetical protein
VVEGISTIGGAGGATVEVDDSFVAIVVVVVPVGAAPRIGSISPSAGFPLALDFLLSSKTTLLVVTASSVVFVSTLPVNTVVSTLAVGELFRLASNATGAESTSTAPRPSANARAPEILLRNHRKAPLCCTFSLSISTSKSSFMSSITIA